MQAPYTTGKGSSAGEEGAEGEVSGAGRATAAQWGRPGGYIGQKNNNRPRRRTVGNGAFTATFGRGTPDHAAGGKITRHKLPVGSVGQWHGHNSCLRL